MPASDTDFSSGRYIGRYLLFGEIAAGGMATVHFGRLSGPAGFSRTVAIKKLHPNLAKDPEFVAMFLDEARLAARIRHPNVVPTLDVVATEGEIFLVMDYVQGESLGRLWGAMRTGKKTTDPRIVASIMSGVLHGLHAAHEARSELGQALNLVHRDVSPQNVLVGVDGVARVLDFGVAKAIGRVQTTREGQIKGKLAYMPPEQLHGSQVSRQTDVYSAAVVTWETLTGRRLFSADNEGALVKSILMDRVPAPSEVLQTVPPAFDPVVMRGLERDPSRRYGTAREMALDLERCAGVASTSEVGDWVESLAGAELSKRAELMAAIEGATPTHPSEKLRNLSSTPSDKGRSPLVTLPDTVAAPRSSGRLAELRSDVSHVAVTPTVVAPAHSRGRVAVLATMVGIGLSVALGLVLANTHRWTGPVATRATHGPAEAANPNAPADDGLAASAPTALPERATSDQTWNVTDLPTAASSAGVAAAVPKDNAAVHSLGGGHASGAGAKARAGSAATSARPVSRATRQDCDPPYTIDELGHKHYKAACLE